MTEHALELNIEQDNEIEREYARRMAGEGPGNGLDALVEYLEKWQGDEKILRRLASRMGVSPSDEAAREAVAITVMKIAVRVGEGKFSYKDVPFRAYAFKVAKHEYFRVVRKSPFRPMDWHEMSETLLTEFEDIQPDLDTRALIERMMKAIRRLSPAQQLLLRLRYWEGLTLAAIAGILHKSPEAIRNDHLRTLRRLRNYLSAFLVLALVFGPLLAGITAITGQGNPSAVQNYARGPAESPGPPQPGIAISRQAIIIFARIVDAAYSTLQLNHVDISVPSGGTEIPIATAPPDTPPIVIESYDTSLIAIKSSSRLPDASPDKIYLTAATVSSPTIYTYDAGVGSHDTVSIGLGKYSGQSGTILTNEIAQFTHLWLSEPGGTHPLIGQTYTELAAIDIHSYGGATGNSLTNSSGPGSLTLPLGIFRETFAYQNIVLNIVSVLDRARQLSQLLIKPFVDRGATSPMIILNNAYSINSPGDLLRLVYVILSVLIFAAILYSNIKKKELGTLLNSNQYQYALTHQPGNRLLGSSYSYLNVAYSKATL